MDKFAQRNSWGGWTVISENSHGNAYSEVLCKVVVYQHGVYWFFQIFKTQRRFLEEIYKSSCPGLINAAMKYLNFRDSGSKLESITCKFTKNRTPLQ